MAKKTKRKAKGGCRMLPVMHRDAAGVDIGAEEIFDWSRRSRKL
jgi:hypothetical protein